MTSPRVGVGCIVRRGRRVLLVRRRGAHGDGTWSTPGGNLDFGEDPSQCAAREVAEETGLAVPSTRFVGVTNDVFEPESRHYVTLWFEADEATGEPGVVAVDEVGEVGWFDQQALPSPLFLPLRNLLEGRSLR